MSDNIEKLNRVRKFVEMFNGDLVELDEVIASIDETPLTENDYAGAENIFNRGMKFQPLDDPYTQTYALKFLFGTLESHRKYVKQQNKGGQKQLVGDKRLRMIKSIIGTISRLPIPANGYYSGGQDFLLVNSANIEETK